MNRATPHDFVLAAEPPSGPTPLPANLRAAELTIADAFQLITADALARFRSNESTFVTSGDPESVHEMRVALRQLLSAFWVFKPVLRSSSRCIAIKHQLRDLNQQLGAIRNLDVCMTQSREGSKEHAWLSSRRARLFETARDRANSSDRKRLVSKTVNWVESGNWRRDVSAYPDFGALMRARLDQLWHKILRFGGRPSKLGRYKRHRLRLRIKTLNCSLDFLELPVCPAKRHTNTFRTEVQALQKTLGRLNDLETRRDFRIAARLRPKRYRRAKSKEAHRGTQCLRKLRKIGPHWQRSSRDYQQLMERELISQARAETDQP